MVTTSFFIMRTEAALGYKFCAPSEFAKEIRCPCRQRRGGLVRLRHDSFRKKRRQPARFLKYGGHDHPFAAAALSLSLAPQDLIGTAPFPALFLLTGPCIMAVESSERNE